MGLRARLESWIDRVWQHRGALSWLLAPASLLHLLWWRFDRWRYRVGFAHAERVGVPVVVIGNLNVGGTGKTPLVIEVVRALVARGWTPDGLIPKSKLIELGMEDIAEQIGVEEPVAALAKEA